MADALNEEDKKRVLRRLKKILALADSDNPGEAAAALHQARVLMDKYGLEQADAQESAIEETELVASGTELARWESSLAGVVAAALGVSIVIRKFVRKRGLTRPKATIVFIAESHKSQLAKYAFEILRKKLRKAMSQSFEAMLISAGVNPKALRINAQQRDAYAYAWCKAIREKVEALAPAVAPEVDSYISKMDLTEPKPQKEGSKRKDIFADPLALHMYRQGIQDGASVELHNAVGVRAGTPLLL